MFSDLTFFDVNTQEWFHNECFGYKPCPRTEMGNNPGSLTSGLHSKHCIVFPLGLCFVDSAHR